MFDVIIYHSNCVDGFSSFYCFWKFKLLKNNFRAIIDKPSATECPNGLENKDVVIVDVAYKNDIILKITNKAKSVLFIDHHKTIIDDVQQIKAKNLKIIYNIDECAASLSWKYCSSIAENKVNMPKVIKLVRDNDIGLWYIKETKPFITAIRLYLNIRHASINDLKKFDLLLNENELKKIITLGETYIVYKNHLINEIIQGYTMKKFKFESHIYNVAVINTNSPLNSEIGTEIAKLPNVDFCIVWYYNHRKKFYLLSFRSKKIDVGEIAKKYGGGGHTLASACTITTFIDDIFE